MKKLIISIILCHSAVTLTAQQKVIDSLEFLLTKEKTDTGRIDLLVDIGKKLGHAHQKDSASWYFQKATDFSKKINYPRGEYLAQFAIAQLFYYSDNFSEALSLSLQNLKKIEQFRDTSQLFWQLRLITWIYSDIGDNQTAKEYANKMRALVNSGFYKSPELEDIETVSNATIGTTYLDLGKLDSALYFVLHVYEYALKMKDTQFLALSPLWLGGIYSKLGNIDSSFYYFRTSIYYARHSIRIELIQAAELGIADLYYKTGQTDSAFYYALNSMNEFRKLGDSASLIDAYSLISKLYRTKHRFDSAFTYLQQYVTIRDSLLNQKKISEAQNFVFNQTFHDQQIDQARREAEEQYKTKIKLYILSAIIFAILTVAILLMRNISNKRAANIQLQNQKGEVEEQKKYAEKTLAELKTTQAQLIQSEKMASLGELTAGIAHEIQNPLNFVNNFAQVNAELIEEAEMETDAGNPEEVKKLLRSLKDNQVKINQHGQRADAIVKGMLQHSRASTGQKESTDLNAIAEEYLRMSYHGVRVKDKEFNASLLTDLDTAASKVSLVPQDIGRVLLNIYNNAFYAVSEKKKHQPAGYEPTVSVSTKRIDNKVNIRVRDNGNGIPQKILGKIFQPFFTTKPTGQGTGLGLSLSYDIVRAHGGEIKAETKEGEFTEFVILLPV